MSSDIVVVPTKCKLLTFPLAYVVACLFKLKSLQQVLHGAIFSLFDLLYGICIKRQVNATSFFKEGDIGVCGIAVMANFSCGISVILI